MKREILCAALCAAIYSPASAQAYRVEAGPAEIGVIRRDGRAVVSGEGAFQQPDHFVWGASVIRGDDGRYYMVYSAVPTGKYAFDPAWVLSSKMGLAVSDRPDGGFRHLGFFLNEDGFRPDRSAWDAQTVMNPHLRKFGDRYYLYYVGGVDLGNDRVRSADGTLPLRARVQQSLRIGVIAFESFDDLLAGRFERSFGPLLAPRTRVKPNDIVDPSPAGTQPKPDNIIVVNPAVVCRPTDGKYLLYFKGNLYDPTWRGVHGVAIGDSPTGPFVPQDCEVLTIEGADKRLSAEDPYVWYSGRDSCFYAVFKDFTGAFTRSEPCLAVMRSRDGIEWELPEQSLFMKKQVVLPSGEVAKVARLERPQLLVDEQGVPLVLYCACAVDEVNARVDGGSFNVQIPLRNEAR
ncbi:glycoside hydrolase family protein [uncultured Rikenella sp.]|uniref:glycoside hydrolase family protein n=1 Tax=uncultured Rikenella sp. TaxID=368003 RepID=UPI002600C065|nr:glycoside hydrolase family protein [uncultured Rikenella sp.]